MCKKAILSLVLFVLAVTFSACKSAAPVVEWQKNTDSYTFFTVNDIQWTAHWEWFYRPHPHPKAWENKVVLVYIEASYNETDKTSKYYDELRRRHGDNTVYVNFSYHLFGAPLEDNWFLIELQLLVTNGWDDSEVFLERTTRYEEKFIFDVPSQPYSP